VDTAEVMKVGDVKVSRVSRVCEGDKRQRVPFVIEWKCPKCGAEHMDDYSGSEYLSYPIWGKPQETHLYCPECGHEQPVTITVEMTMKVEWRALV
jgi:predicted RNA-binding Zn-ribbon protein involved in translation (DUF1610 family)